MRISDWSSDVCSSDLARHRHGMAVSRPTRCDRGGGDGARPAARHMERPPFAGHDPPGKESDPAYPAPGCLAQIGIASSRERVCQYVSISVVDRYLQKNTTYNKYNKIKTLLIYL